MLVLSRKSGERIRIGENITIEIRRVAGNRVTLALEAPRTVRILRGELEETVRDFRDTPTSDEQPGPEPYEVIRRRLNVVPVDLASDEQSQPVSRDYAL